MLTILILAGLIYVFFKWTKLVVVLFLAWFLLAGGCSRRARYDQPAPSALYGAADACDAHLPLAQSATDDVLSGERPVSHAMGW